MTLATSRAPADLGTESGAPSSADQPELLRIRLMTSKKVTVLAAVMGQDADSLEKARADFFRKVSGQVLAALAQVDRTTPDAALVQDQSSKKD